MANFTIDLSALDDMYAISSINPEEIWGKALRTLATAGHIDVVLANEEQNRITTIEELKLFRRNYLKSRSIPDPRIIFVTSLHDLPADGAESVRFKTKQGRVLLGSIPEFRQHFVGPKEEIYQWSDVEKFEVSRLGTGLTDWD